MIAIVEPGTTIEDIANLYNTSVDEIKADNDLSSAELKAYQPVRVRRTNDGVVSPISLTSAANSPEDITEYNTSNTSGCLLYTSPSPRDRG